MWESETRAGKKHLHGEKKMSICVWNSFLTMDIKEKIQTKEFFFFFFWQFEFSFNCCCKNIIKNITEKINKHLFLSFSRLFKFRLSPNFFEVHSFYLSRPGNVEILHHGKIWDVRILVVLIIFHVSCHKGFTIYIYHTTIFSFF